MRPDKEKAMPAARKNRRRSAFALYEVLLGVTVFVIGVVALGRSVQNCLNASMLSAEENRVRLILSNRMSEIQATPGNPDTAKVMKIDHLLDRSIQALSNGQRQRTALGRALGCACASKLRGKNSVIAVPRRGVLVMLAAPPDCLAKP